MPTQYLLFAALAASALNISTAFSAEFGTIEQAKAMLDRAVVEMRVDQGRAIDKFNHNERPFRDRDLFVFCFDGRDGGFTAHEAFVGQDVRKLSDRNGRSFGAEMFSKAQEDRIAEIVFVSPVPGSIEQAVKVSYVTRIGDQVCGVSAFRFNDPGNSTQ